MPVMSLNTENVVFKNKLYVNYEYHKKKGCHFGNLETRKLTMSL